MSNSSLVNYVKLSPHYRTRTGKISKITIHHMAGNLSVETCGNVFSKSRVASSNYGIGSDGRIGLYVEEANRAITSSSTTNDNVAVTIEVANNSGAPNWTVSDKAMSSLIKLCVDICQRNDIKEINYTGDSSGNLTRHNMFTATTCPGPYLQGKFPWIAQEINKQLQANVPTPAPTPAPAGHSTIRRGSSGAQVRELQEKLAYIGYSISVDGDFGPATESAVKDFQGNAGLGVDGICGSKTWTTLDAVYAEAKSYSVEDFVRDVQRTCGAKVDGIPGSETLSKTPTVSKSKNNKHPVVKLIQRRLYIMGYAIVGSADGAAGSKFDKAIKELQKDRGSYVDGEVTSGKTTWKILLGMSK